MGLFVTDIFFVPSARPQDSLSVSGVAGSSTLKFLGPGDTKISDDFGPRIDSEAAAIVKKDNKIIPLCQTLPGELWILLLAAYLFLLFFNLFYDFENAWKIRWFWEGLYTLLALFGWYAWDSCHINIWFPLYVIKLGVIVYLVYLYLFYKQKELWPLSIEDLENFEG